MKKSIITVLLTAALLTAPAAGVRAQGEPTVAFTADNRLEYSNVTEENGTVNLGDAFQNVAPGETRSQTIRIENHNRRTADFYMSAETVKALEENTASAKGAGYEMKLTAGNTVLYDSSLGGYKGGDEGTASTAGIGEMNGVLKDYILIATLAKGAYTDVVFSITFDGEAMDNTASADYSRTYGQIAFDFKAGYEDPSGPVVVYKEVKKQGEAKKANKLVEIIEEAVPLGAVATGDAAMIGIGLLVLGTGVLLILVGKKKKEKE